MPGRPAIASARCAAAIGAAGRLVAEVPRLWFGGARAGGSGPVRDADRSRAARRAAASSSSRRTSAASRPRRRAMPQRYRPHHRAVPPGAQGLAARRWSTSARARPNLATAPTTLAGVRRCSRRCRPGRPWACCPTRCRPQGQGVWAPFFGKPAYTMTLPARLAQQTGAAVLLAWGERLARGRGYRIHLRRLGRRAAPRAPAAAARAGQRADGSADPRMPRAVPLGLRALQDARGRRG